MDSEPCVSKVSPALVRARNLERTLDQHAWQCAITLTLLFLATAIALSARSKMWFDELFTYYLVHQASSAEVTQALIDGCDAQPPLYPLIIRALSPLLGSGALALRLPSAIGVSVMGLCVFAFVFRRFPAIYAMTAMLFTFNSTRYFATQARCYGLLLGCAGVALLCWQRVTESRHRLLALSGLGLSLATGISLHYLTVFFLLPLGAGELARWRMSGKPDLPVLGVMAVSPLVLIPHLPLIEAAKQFIQFFWAKASLSFLVEFYYDYFLRYSPCLLLPVLLFILAQYSTRVATHSTQKGRPGLSLDEWVVNGGLVLTPAVVLLICFFTTKTFVGRYVVWSAAGVAIVATAALFRAVRGDAITAAIAVILLLGTLGTRTVRRWSRAEQMALAAETNTELSRLPESPLPIVVAKPNVFLELAFYGDPKLRARLVYPLNPELDRLYVGIDTNPRLLSALRRYVPLRVPDYNDFITSTQHFLLAADSQDWLIWHLVMSGFRVTPLDRRWPTGIFEVEPL